jgi:hypothetical protein
MLTIFCVQENQNILYSCAMFLTYDHNSVHRICSAFKVLYLHNPDVVQSVWRGHAIAQTVSCHLPTTAARVWTQVKSWGMRDGQCGTEAGFLQVPGFPLPVLIPPNAPYSSIIWGWYNTPINDWCTKRTQYPPTPQNKQKKNWLTQKYKWWHMLRIYISIVCMSPSCNVVDKDIPSQSKYLYFLSETTMKRAI